MKHNCKNCKFHDCDTWVCTNVDSSYVADFTDDNDWCNVFEADENSEETENV